MINKTKLIAVSLTVAFTFVLAFPLLGIGAAENSTQSSSCYETIIDRIAQERGITKEEAKAQFDAKISEIAKKKGITVEELKKQIDEGKFRKGHRKPLNEEKLKEIAEKKGLTVDELMKEIAEKKGITVEELKQRMNKYNCDDAKAHQ